MQQMKLAWPWSLQVLGILDINESSYYRIWRKRACLVMENSPKSPCKSVYVAPGNGGTDLESNITNVNISSDDIEGLSTFALKNKIDLTIVGPEDPLVNGITDNFTEKGLKCFGPTKDAAKLEGSKDFMKKFLEDNQIPTAEYKSFKTLKRQLIILKKKAAL